MIQNDAKVRGCLVLQLGSNCVLGGGGGGVRQVFMFSIEKLEN